MAQDVGIVGVRIPTGNPLSPYSGVLPVFVTNSPHGFEYRVVDPSARSIAAHENLEAHLNSLGAEGWDLVAHHPEHGFVFKRHRSADPTQE